VHNLDGNCMESLLIEIEYLESATDEGDNHARVEEAVPQPDVCL